MILLPRVLLNRRDTLEDSFCPSLIDFYNHMSISMFYGDMLPCDKRYLEIFFLLPWLLDKF